jgi:uncharacterized membrane protein YeaQ/YmgE (transglycosylase-associated protein family)
VWLRINLKQKEHITKMKGLEHLTEILSILVGMVGALIKSIKKKVSLRNKIISMVVAGILCYTAMGLVQMLYGDLPQKVSILVAFVVGWTANEITDKMDIFVDDLYDYFLGWMKNKKSDQNGK